MADSFFVDIRGGMKSIGRAAKGGFLHPNLKVFDGIDEFDVLNDDPRGLARAASISILMMRCITVIANTFGGLPLTYKYDNDEEVPKDHPMRRALSERHTRLWRGLAKDMQIFGVGYWIPTERGIRRANPIGIEVLKDERGIQGFKHSVDGRLINTYRPDDVVYFFDYDPEDDFGSVSPTQMALRVAKIEIALDTFVSAFFENDATPGGLLVTDQRLTRAQALEYRTRWEKMYKGVQNAFRAAVMGQGIRWESVTPLLKDLVLTEVGEATARRICQAYGVPLTMALATEAANYATAKDSHIMFYLETLLPFADLVLDEVNLQLSPFYKGPPVTVEVDRNQVEVLSEDRLEISQRTAGSFQAGYLTINDAREAEGLKPIKGGDVLVVGGQWVTLKQLEAGKYPSSDMGGGAPFRSTDTPQGGMPIQPALNPPRYETQSGEILSPIKSLADGAPGNEDAYVVLSLANDPALVRETASLRHALSGEQLDWQPANEYHLTLVYGHNPDPASLVRLEGALPRLPDAPLRLLHLGVLSDALVLFAEPFEELLDYQRALAEQVRGLGWPLSEYSEPHAWKPHVTLAYGASKLGVDPLRVPFKPFTATPTAVVLNKSDGQGNFPVIAATKHHARYTKELEQWEYKALNKHGHAPFRAHSIPPATAAFLAQELRATDRDDASAIKAIFAAYKQVDATLATPEEFEQYWRGIDELNRGLEDDLAKWLSLVQDEIVDAVKVGGGTPDFEVIGGKLAEMLVGLLAGAPGDPGSLAKIFLAGAGRANDLLRYVGIRKANPHATKAAEPAPHEPPKLIEPAWDIINQQAVDFARNHAYEMVRGINDTTRDIFQQKIAEWSASGGHLDELADALLGELSGLNVPGGWSPGKLLWAVSPQRAALIAQTEVTRAFTRGVQERWKQAGVQKIRWRTNNDPRVCPQCRRLNNRIGDIGQGILDPQTGRYAEPPVHPGCRCFTGPVTRRASSIT